VLLYNPLARARTELVKLPVAGPNNYNVYDERGVAIPSQTVASFEPFPKNKPAPFLLYFEASVKGLGYTTYFVQPTSNLVSPAKWFTPQAPITIQNSAVSVTFSDVTGRLSSITNKASGVTSAISQDFFYYASYQGNDQRSGAYIFRPNSTSAYNACPGIPQFQVITGPVLNEIRYMQCNWLAQIVRLSGQDSFVEFEYRVSSIPIMDGQGKELISRFSSDVQSSSFFFTDSNGREFQTRKLNFRPTWPLQVTEPVAGNYYPVNAAAYIKDTNKQLSILNDRSQSAASINNGQIEIMVHRRLLRDDSRGVGEPLNETDSITPYPNPVRIGDGLHITGSFYLLLDKSSSAVTGVRALQSRVFLPLVLAFTPTGSGVNAITQWIQTHNVQNSFITRDLPTNVDLMTLQIVPGQDHMIRLSHQFAMGEDPALSQPVTVDLSTLFSSLPLNNLQEVSLTANQPAQDIEDNLPDWQVKGENANVNTFTYPTIPFNGLSVTINPMDIRTFTFSAAKK